ncbi:uncharacterized protein LOC130783418 isoform X2 [Actinidia eriantha]|uniref:uncharacterized protein LOC130783418 isoform X2 n=1 Tax=Actinidia eriantha TaxID=165200 RepID=UPI00258839A0|nr:uncharacterized protein LOC130783418 isoform X2 [Actinidia eriantha]XP_057499006.1 uncharacterized protein LOC130783418 isoform X2 [Actinidia eriantha]XP_057499008.1 uncharacterized protein LOC130783418 isoform X2 [Actinidia eriantha]
MDRWSGILKVPLHANSMAHYKVAVSLCTSPSSTTLTTPSANVIFFNGDRVKGTGNPVIERLSDLQRIAEILVSKFGSSINAWVIESSTFNGPFAVYKDFIPSVNSWGEPKSYNPTGFLASTSTVNLLSNCLREAKHLISGRQEEPYQARVSASSAHQPKTFILGFSKGGTVINQLVTELGFSAVKTSEYPENANKHMGNEGLINIQKGNQIIPNSKESLLDSITEIHYVDVGLNSAGAYLTDGDVIERLSKRLMQRPARIRFVLHGTPRQWCDSRRAWIGKEKEKMLQLLKSEAQKSGGKLHVCERLYFAGKPPSLQMHFEIIENLEVG